MAVLDADGDVRLSAAEFATLAHPSVSFAEFDRDADGAVDVPELDTLLRARGPLLPDHAGKLELPDPTVATFGSFDADGDGRIARAEWRGDGFAEADVDADGGVEVAELRAWIARPPDSTPASTPNGP